MRKVILRGELAEKFGAEFTLHVKTLREALSLLCANFPGFRQDVMQSDARLQGYEVWDGDYNLEGKEEEFQKEGQGPIEIIPVLRGSTSTARIIIGVVLVAVGLWTSWAGGASLVVAGIGMIAGGIAEKLAKTTTISSDTAKTAKSYVFSGAVNTETQGAPVAIGYGKMIVGSSVISKAITPVDVAV